MAVPPSMSMAPVIAVLIPMPCVRSVATRMRRRAAAQMTLLILSAGLVALFGGILFLGVGGLI